MRVEDYDDPADCRRPPYFAEPEPAVKLADARLVAGSNMQIRGPKRLETREVFDDLKAPPGASPTYARADIMKAAEDVLKNGVPDRQAWFIAKVVDLCMDRHIKVPGDTWLKDNLGPIHKSAKVASRRG
jgi:hypothetical protein